MALAESDVRAALGQVRHPRAGADLVAAGMVRAVEVSAAGVRVVLALPPPAGPHQDAVADQARAAVARVAGRVPVFVQVTTGAAVPAPAHGQAGHDHAGHAHGEPGHAALHVHNIVAVGAGKGGVGKSTVAANLAVALAKRGHAVGLLDGDIYGPSIPTMLGVKWKPDAPGPMEPPVAHGVKVMSLGFFLEDPDQPVAWRGPMIHKTIAQFLGGVRWGHLDWLIVDLPPGTGDVQLTLAQSVPLTGGVVVCTPQDVALLDARKAVRMFQKLNAPVLGMIENMSGFVCGHCGHTTDIFKRDGVKRAAAELGVPFLGALPLDARIPPGGDDGTPAVAGLPESDPVARAFFALADGLARETAARKATATAPATPKITR